MAGLAVDGIHTYYEESHVLHGVTLAVGPGEAVALLGRNGAGKTTVIRSIVGFTPPRAGRVIWEDTAIEGWPPYRIARRGIALVPQGRRIFAPLSVRENLTIGARAAGWSLERVFDLFPRLRERQAQAGGTLSGGEQQMLAIGRALLTNGRLLLLDEPSEGLAPIVVRAHRSLICMFGVCGRKAGRSHDLSLNPIESTTSVSPSHIPIECPIHVGSTSGGCGRPSRNARR